MGVEAPRSSLKLLAAAAGSAEGSALGDDSLKDMHVAGWIMRLESGERAEWLERVRWVRILDRMAEESFLHGTTDFAECCEAWEDLLRGGTAERWHRFASMLQPMRACWFGAGDRPRDDDAIRAFDAYVHAIRRYHENGRGLETMAELEPMLQELSGSILLCMPSVPRALCVEVVALGAADQLYNNVRDICEDAARGLCLWPRELLDHFGVRKADLRSGRIDAPRVGAMSRYVIFEIGHRLRRRYPTLLVSGDMSTAWRMLVRDFERRYDAVERALVDSAFDPVQFTETYWRRASADVRGRTGDAARRA
jgi:phytoene synthase